MTGIPLRSVVLVAVLLAGGPAGVVEKTERAWWPQFHGPNRDNISREGGLLRKWPEGGPRLLWKYADCGDGFSMVAVAEGKIFTAGDFEDREMVLALDLQGKLIWKTPNGRSWIGPHPGSRTTPTYDGGVLYHMNPLGRLAALRAESGQEIWAVDLRSKFEAEHGRWAMAENILVEGDRVFCAPGGKKGRLVALDRKSGATLWANRELDDGPAYCSPIVVTHGGVRQLITLMQKSVVSVDVESGKLLWSHPHVTPHDQNVTAPIYHDGHVFVTSGHAAGGRLLRIRPDRRGVTEVWHRTELDNCHGGVILLDGKIHGSACRLGKRGFFCADFLTGEPRYNDGRLGKVSITCADGMLYGLNDRGKMFLLEMIPDGLRIRGQFDVPRESRDKYLSHPVVCGGRLYIRHGSQLYVYDVRVPATP